MKRAALPILGMSSREAARSESDLHALVRRGTLELTLFLLVSSAFFACRHCDLLAPLSEGARALLGDPPPPFMTTMAVIGYSLSAGVLILARAATGARPQQRWLHLFFRTIFFPFYLFSGALAENFLGAFVAGLLLFFLEHLNLWTYSLRIFPRKALFGKP